ncbi:MAG TPA: fused MFS/spermidine synthase [Actinomycetota bacterium]|nr:fused MFS/spermidine synthase [Actinomycetota bacterium]
MTSDTAVRAPESNVKRRSIAVLALYVVTLFTGSALLFLVQPMFAKMVLPLLGGTPAVWATSMVFFQAVLLAGYAYAHWSVARFGIRRQALIHMPLVLLPLLLLPISVPTGWTPPEERPVFWLLWLLTFALGLPFFVLSTSAPLLQRWFSSSGHPSGKDPYFLYAASNAGSMLALLAYPFLMEPSLPLADQTQVWAIGYGVLAAGTIACALVTRRGRAEEAEVAADTAEDASVPKPTTARRLRWVALAFVPSSFMLAVTTYISTDIAAIPLLWVVPLALYLLTFIIVFSSSRPFPLVWATRVQAIVFITLVLVMLLDDDNLPRRVVLGLPLLALLLASLLCHAQLAADRPPPKHLTEFYLWIAVGGVLGGIFTALVAPVVFDSLVEYPLAIVLACMLMPTLSEKKVSARRERIFLVVIPAAFLLVTVLLILGAQQMLPTIGRIVALTVALSLCALLVTRPLRFGLALGAVMIGAFLATNRSPVLYSERTFFGVQQVLGDEGGRFHRLMHGTTLHGIQSTDPNLKTEPLSYYHRDSPVGQVLQELPVSESPRIGVIGLGTGSLACYASPDQQWTFFEIDPEMERIARNPRLFSFLSDCPGRHDVVIGDARLSLEDVPDGRFGVLVVDAFNSDSIPVHLLTREAMELYLSKLTPGGVVVVHISNRYLDLRPVVGNLSYDLGLVSLFRSNPQTLEQTAMGRSASDWVVIGRSLGDLGPLAADSRWISLVAEPGARVWTDDFSDVFSVFRWRTQGGGGL